MQGDRSGATEDWERVEELSSGPDYLARETDRWAMALYSMGDAAAAADVLREALPRVGHMAQLDNSMWIVRMLLRTGDLDAALEAFDGDPEAPTLEGRRLRAGAAGVRRRATPRGDRQHRAGSAARARGARSHRRYVDAHHARRAGSGRGRHLLLVGDRSGAESAADRARKAYQRKGTQIMADHVDDWLSAAEKLRGSD